MSDDKRLALSNKPNHRNPIIWNETKEAVSLLQKPVSYPSLLIIVNSYVLSKESVQNE